MFSLVQEKVVEEEEYDLVPHSRLDKLEKDVNVLKANPLGATPVGNDILSEMRELNKSIKALLDLFKDATEEMKLEEKDTQTFGKRFEPMMDKMDMLIDQNKKIARGIIAVADMVKDTVEKAGSNGEQRIVPIAPRPYGIQHIEESHSNNSGNVDTHGLLAQENPMPKPAGPIPPPSFGSMSGSLAPIPSPMFGSPLPGQVPPPSFGAGPSMQAPQVQGLNIAPGMPRPPIRR